MQSRHFIAAVALVTVTGCRPAPPAAGGVVSVAPAAVPHADADASASPTTGAIAGTVMLAGRPFTGATVCALGTHADDDAELACVTSQPGGTYRFAALAPATYRVWAAAGSTASQPRQGIALAAAQTRDDVALTLQGGLVPVRGRAIDSRGRPIAGVTLVVDGHGTGDVVASTVVTDAAGAFTAWAPPGEVDIASYVAGEPLGGRRAAAPVGSLQLQVRRERLVQGRVVLATTGAPVAGALVREAASRGDAGAGVRTDATGRFQIGIEPAGWTQLAGSAPGLYGVAAAALVRISDDPSEIVIALHPAAQVRGRLVVAAATGSQPCSSERRAVVLQSASLGVPAAISATGEAVFDAVPPGRYDVHAACGSYPARAYPPVVVGEAAVDGLAWTFDAGLVVRGQVTALVTQAPLARVRVEVAGRFAWTDHTGNFEVLGVPPGSHQLTCARTGYAEATVSVVGAAGAPTPIAVALEPRTPTTGQLSLTVMDERGSDLLDPSVRITGEGRDETLFCMVTCEVPDLLPGHYQVTAGTRSAPVVIAAGATSSVGLVVPALPGVVTGIVVDATGQPVAGARVTVAGDPRIWGPLAATDATGAFRLEGIAGAPMTLVATLEDGARGTVKAVQPGSSVRIGLVPPASVSARVVEADGTPARWAAVTAMARGTREHHVVRTFEQGGEVTLRGLPAGDYQLVVDGATATGVGVTLGPGAHRSGITLTAPGPVAGQTGRVPGHAR